MDTRPTKVLLVEDNPVEARLIQDLVRKTCADQYAVERVDRLSTATRLLREQAFGVLLLDLVLPDSQGLDTFAKVQAQAPGVPVIVLTSIDDETLAATAVQQGAQDYLLKAEVDGRLLGRSLRYAIERSRAEAQLRHQASLVRSISDAVISVDMRFNIVSWNRAAEFTYGWSAEEVVGEPVAKILRTEYLHEPEGEVLCHLMRFGFWRGEVIQTRKDGGVTNILSSVALMEDSSGRPQGLVAVNRDITDRVWSEQALHQNEEKYRNLFHYSNDGIVLHSPEGSIIDVNQMALNQFGYTAEEILSLNVSDLHPPEASQAARKALEGISQDGYTRFEIEFRAKSGRAFPAEVSSSSFEIAGEPVIQAIIRDTTERVRAEEALKDYSERLEELVAQRTQELYEAQEQLVRRERLAVLGQLAGGLGHELRGPLGTIAAAAYYLSSVLEPSEPETVEAFEILEQEVATAEGIISSLLDYAGVKPPDLTQVELATLIQKVLDGSAVPANVEIVSQVGEAEPLIWADPDQLERVFGNLIRNAIQAMPDGGVLTIAFDHPNCDWDLVSFSDTGVGIPSENLSMVFEPLFTTKAKGIGLGLALAKTLIAGHRGKILVESEVGRGTTFTVELPTDRAEENPLGREL
jgi:PAS domain S-box-containing protein